jgi:hypothetical protein
LKPTIELDLLWCVEDGDFAKGKPLPLWAMAATSADAVPFLKAL